MKHRLGQGRMMRIWRELAMFRLGGI